MKNTLLTLTLCFMLYFSTSAQTKNFIDQPYIEVSGKADTLVTPNQIYIKIVISEADTKDKISLEEQEFKMVTALKNIGIETEIALSTRDILSNYKSYLFKQKDILKTKEYVLEVNSAKLASNVFIRLEEIGISNISIEKVDHTDFDNLENNCRSRAIKDSHKKAIALTKPLSQTVGKAIQINEFGENIPVNYSDYLYQNNRFYSERKSESETPNIDFEKIKISVNVNVIYILN